MTFYISEASPLSSSLKILSRRETPPLPTSPIFRYLRRWIQWWRRLEALFFGRNWRPGRPQVWPSWSTPHGDGLWNLSHRPECPLFRPPPVGLASYCSHPYSLSSQGLALGGEYGGARDLLLRSTFPTTRGAYWTSYIQITRDAGFVLLSRYHGDSPPVLHDAGKFPELRMGGSPFLVFRHPGHDLAFTIRLKMKEITLSSPQIKSTGMSSAKPLKGKPSRKWPNFRASFPGFTAGGDGGTGRGPGTPANTTHCSIYLQSIFEGESAHLALLFVALRNASSALPFLLRFFGALFPDKIGRKKIIHGPVVCSAVVHLLPPSTTLWHERGGQ